MFRRLVISALLIVFAGVLLAACGSNDDGTNAAPGDQASSSGPDAESLGHIHGLGVDPRDGTLYIATHHGLFQAPKGSAKAERVGESTQDIMGFSLVGPDHFIGSGHPGPDQNLPPNLGLIESRDGGRTWENVSLLGEADFHVLRSAGERVYGFDGTQGRLMASSDGGRNWDEHSPPAAMFDLAIDAEQSDRIIASTEQGIFSSVDGGQSWREANTEQAGLLAWPERNSLYLVDAQGQVLRSRDGGKQFDPAGNIGGQPVAFMADRDELYAALPDGTVNRSTDGGETWTVRAAP